MLSEKLSERQPLLLSYIPSSRRSLWSYHPRPRIALLWQSLSRPGITNWTKTGLTTRISLGLELKSLCTILAPFLAYVYLDNLLCSLWSYISICSYVSAPCYLLSPFGSRSYATATMNYAFLVILFTWLSPPRIQPDLNACAQLRGQCAKNQDAVITLALYPFHIHSHCFLPLFTLSSAPTSTQKSSFNAWRVVYDRADRWTSRKVPALFLDA
jgi:hypothetical protein